MGELWWTGGNGPALLLVVGFILGDLFTAGARRLFLRRGWVDDAGGDALKIHAEPVPTAGGVGILLAWALAWGAALLELGAGTNLLVPLLIPALVLARLGFADDRRGLAPSVRLTVEILAGLLFALLFNLTGFEQPGESVPWWQSLWLWGPVFTVGGVNAMNMQDGRDGVAGGLSVISLLGCALAAGVAFRGNDFGFPAACLAAAAATLGFLLHNRPPARVYLGDCGAYLLGFLCAAPAGVMAAAFLQSGEWRLAGAAILLVGVPVLDAGAAILRRWARGRPLFSGDRDHVYDLLAKRGLGPWQVAITMWTLQAFVVLMGVWAIGSGTARFR